MEARNWHRQLETGSYLCSTNPEYLQVDVINAAFTSDMLWWARALPVQSMKTMLDNCLCLGIYKLGEGQGDASSTAIGVYCASNSLTICQVQVEP